MIASSSKPPTCSSSRRPQVQGCSSNLIRSRCISRPFHLEEASNRCSSVVAAVAAVFRPTESLPPFVPAPIVPPPSCIQPEEEMSSTSSITALTSSTFDEFLTSEGPGTLVMVDFYTVSLSASCRSIHPLNPKP